MKHPRSNLNASQLVFDDSPAAIFSKARGAFLEKRSERLAMLR